MYTRLAAHSIERGTTYSTCVHGTELDTAYTHIGRSRYERRYQLRNSHTRYRPRYRLHTIRLEPVPSVIPCTQHVQVVPELTSPAAHSLEGVSIVPPCRTSCMQSDHDYRVISAQPLLQNRRRSVATRSKYSPLLQTRCQPSPVCCELLNTAPLETWPMNDKE